MHKLGTFALHVSLFAFAVTATACGSADPTNELKGAGKEASESTTDDGAKKDELNAQDPSGGASIAPPGAPATVAEAGDDPTLDSGSLEATLTSTAQKQGFVAANPVYRAVLGNPGFLCGDLGEIQPGVNQNLQSAWYRVSAGRNSATIRPGSCAVYALGSAYDVAIAHYNLVPGWPGYKCATLPDCKSSMWFVIGSGVRTAQKFSKTCAQLAR